MLVVALRKIWAKKWMFFCMLLGCVLMVSTIISLPLYENAAYNLMLRDEFRMAYEKSGEWPAKYRSEFLMLQRSGGQRLFEKEAFLENMESQLGVTTKECVKYYRTVERQLRTTMGRSDAKPHYNIHICMLSDLGPHVEVLSGEMYSEDGYTEEGYLEVVITPDCMVKAGYILGEVLEFSYYRDANGDLLKIKIVGIVTPKEEEAYWEVGMSEFGKECFISEKAFREIFLGADVNDYYVEGVHCYLFEYDDLVSYQAEQILNVIESEPMLEEIAEDMEEGRSFGAILKGYVTKLHRISATLMILQIPMLILLAVFLFMISKQMYEVERNEIAVIKSRGSSVAQMFWLYFYQTGIQVLGGLIFGIPLGIVFFRMIGSASGFLEFEIERTLEVVFDKKVYTYLGLALLLIVFVMSVPVIKHGKVSIVNLKQEKARTSKAFWEKSFLDVVCLVVGMYGYHSFRRIEDRIAESVLLNEPFNPLIYVVSTIFVVGLGLLYLRLLPLIVKMIYKLGERRWSPAVYSSFLEMIRSNRKQQFIMLFLVMNIAFGIYHATVAHTIMDNTMDNTEYLMPADVRIREVWRDNVSTAMLDSEIEMRFYEPDYAKYKTLDDVMSYTKVYYDDTDESTERVTVNACHLQVQMMLIHPKQFGEITQMKEGLLDEHYYAYLNRLAENENGYIISRNIADRTDYGVGSAITVNYTICMNKENKIYIHYKLPGKIVGVVDYWPGYKPEEVYAASDGTIKSKKNYLVVGSYIPFERSLIKNAQPYEVWIDMEDDAKAESVGQWINGNDIAIEKYNNKMLELERTITDPLLQGTNGILTMEFIVMILLCGVGYLVYWMMSIRDRELMFGILRAFGMHKGEVFGILVLEQIFSGVMTTFVAIGIGQKASELFAPMLVKAYTAAQQVLPMELKVDVLDLLKLYGSIAVVLGISMLVLIWFVFRMNVAEALKLGED